MAGRRPAHLSGDRAADRGPHPRQDRRRLGLPQWRSKLAAYVGLEPVTRQSGTSLADESRSRRGNRRLKNAMFLAVFASAGLIPTIFEPGRIELLLSKPVERYHILLGRYLGNLLVVAFNICYLVVAVWLIFGAKTGVWTVGFLWSAALTIFVFAVLLTVVLLVSVLWESAVVATMVTFALMIVSTILAQRKLIEKLLSSEWSRNVVRALYYALPKVFDLGRISRELVMGKAVDQWMPLWSSALFGAILLSAALYVFSRRNF